MDLAALIPVSAEIFLLVMTCVILIADLMIKQTDRMVTYVLVQLTLIGCTMITWLTHSETVVYTFSNMYVDDLMADVLKLLTYMTVSMVLVYSRQYLLTRHLFGGEFLSLTLFATLGMMVMISANHFLSLYLGLELFSLSLYAMVALQRDSARATEAAMKYFILGALASGLLLYGMSMLYGATGSLVLSEVSESIASGQADDNLLVFGLVFVVAGLAFKLGVVPFHMWVPDVYHGAPTAMTLLIGSAPKLAAFAFVARIMVEGLQPLVQHWSDMLMFVAVASLAFGNIVAIAQTNIKRMFAYSTIAHMGFMLLGILTGSIDGYGAAMFYVVVYVLMTLGGFGMIMLMSKEGFEAENIEDFKGLNHRSPWLAFMMLLLLVSMAGIPPTVGFYAKLTVLNAVVDAGYVGLAVAAVIFSLIGAYYYLRVIKVMYFDQPEDKQPVTVSSETGLLISVNGLSVLALGLLPGALMTICLASVSKSLLLP